MKQYTLETFPSTVVRGIDGPFQDISVSSSMELIDQKRHPIIYHIQYHRTIVGCLVLLNVDSLWMIQMTEECHLSPPIAVTTVNTDTHKCIKYSLQKTKTTNCVRINTAIQSLCFKVTTQSYFDPLQLLLPIEPWTCVNSACLLSLHHSLLFKAHR